jgi:hypothetical protein
LNTGRKEKLLLISSAPLLYAPVQVPARGESKETKVPHASCQYQSNATGEEPLVPVLNSVA